jgi:RNA polymerase sigma factor (sigma-70 family)
LRGGLTELLCKAVYRELGALEEARDIAQRAMTGLFIQIRKHGWEHYGLAPRPKDFGNDDSPAAVFVRLWLVRAARHLCCNATRDSRVRRKAAREIRRRLRLAPVERPDERRERRIRIRRLRIARSRLSPRQRKILYYWSMDLPEKQIAELIGVAAGSASTLVRRAQRALRAAYLKLEAESRVTGPDRASAQDKKDNSSHEA